MLFEENLSGDEIVDHDNGGGAQLGDGIGPTDGKPGGQPGPVMVNAVNTDKKYKLIDPRPTTLKMTKPAIPVIRSWTPKKLFLLARKKLFSSRIFLQTPLF